MAYFLSGAPRRSEWLQPQDLRLARAKGCGPSQFGPGEQRS